MTEEISKLAKRRIPGKNEFQPKWRLPAVSDHFVKIS